MVTDGRWGIGVELNGWLEMWVRSGGIRGSGHSSEGHVRGEKGHARGVRRSLVKEVAGVVRMGRHAVPWPLVPLHHGGVDGVGARFGGKRICLGGAVGFVGGIGPRSIPGLLSAFRRPVEQPYVFRAWQDEVPGHTCAFPRLNVARRTTERKKSRSLQRKKV